MNPLLLALPGGLAIPALVAVLGGILYTANKKAKSQSSNISVQSELNIAQTLQLQSQLGNATSTANATAALVNNFNPQALVNQSLSSSSFTKSITDLVNTSTAPLQAEISGLTKVVNQIPKNQTVQINAPTPAGPSPGFLGMNSWL